MSVPLAHAGHWLVNLLYLAPIAGVVGWLSAQAWRDRRRARRAGDGDAPEQSPT